MSDAPAPAIVAPETRDLTELAAALGGWLGARLPGVSDVRVANLEYPLGAGMSHETILFDAAWRQDGSPHERGMVVRIKPRLKTVYQDDMFAQQYRLMRLMHESGAVRVAEPLWFEEDAKLLGAPFFVMAKVAGRVAVSYPPYSQSGWLFDATPAERRRTWEDAVRQLALIQRVDLANAEFLSVPGGPAGFDQETDRWRRYMHWVDPQGQHAMLHKAFDRLLALKPGNRPEGIVWGDARLGNMMIAADHSVAAVMDWEQPSLGGALHDLAWWTYSDMVQTVARAIPRLEGMGTREETVALWCAVSGKSAMDLEWYEAFACFKMECLAIRMVAIRDLPLPKDRPASGISTLRMLGTA